MGNNNQNNIPKISVVIPTHNRPDRIKTAVESVLAQTFKDFEVIVVDDGMKERAESVVKSIDDERIVYIQHKENRGGGAARNTGIKNAKGELVAFLDDDDEWFPEKLERQYKAFEKHKDDIGFLFCGIRLYYEGKEGFHEPDFLHTGVYDFHMDLLAHNLRTYTPTLMIKREILEKVGGFDESFPSNQEWELMIRISSLCKGYCLPEILVKVNFLAGDHIGGSLDRRIEGREKLLNKHIDELKKYPKILAWHYFQLGIFCRDNEQYSLARANFYNALKTRFSLLHLRHYVVLLFGGGGYKLIRGFFKL